MRALVREATRDDLGAVADIAARTFALACATAVPPADIASYIGTELSERKFREHLAAPSRTLHVVEHGQVVRGYMMLCRESAPEELRARAPLELSRIYVLPEHHGTGLATALLDAAITRFHDGTHDTLWLRVSHDNRRAIAFYARHGFSIAGRCLFPLGNVTYEGHLMSLT